MENNSDKAMRDKLRRVEVPFDPQAWEQMDAMLEKDRKPKAFIWWWTGGIAAALLIGAGIFGYHQLTNGKSSVNNLAVSTGKQNNNETSLTILNRVEGRSGKAVQPAGGKQLKTTNTVTKENSAPVKQSETKAVAIYQTDVQRLNYKPASAGNKSKHLTPIALLHNTVYNTTATDTKHAVKQKEQYHQAWKQNENNTDSAGRLKAGLLSAGQLNVAVLADGVANFLAERTKTELAYLFLRGPDMLTACEQNAGDEIKKQDGDDIDLKKLRKKLLFNYSLGVAANITGTTLGNQGSKNIFDKKPSYMIGIAQDFMFLKRLAITTGFMFSQTSFTVSDFNYTCNITELNIPVGIKAYLVSKSKVRFYLDAGIINHIKLKETFVPINPITLSNSLGAQTPGIINLTSPYTNSFSGYDQSATGSYSINKGRRYYASFYTGAGAEFIVKSRLIFFTEPIFYMSLEKITEPDRYKYNLGLSGGIRYQF